MKRSAFIMEKTWRRGLDATSCSQRHPTSPQDFSVTEDRIKHRPPAEIEPAEDVNCQARKIWQA